MENGSELAFQISIRACLISSGDFSQWLSESDKGQRKPANTRSVNGGVWKSTLKHRWPEFRSFLPALISLCFCLQVFVKSYKYFCFQPAQKVGESWQKAQLGNDAFAEKHENVFLVSIERCRCLLYLTLKINFHCFLTQSSASQDVVTHWWYEAVLLVPLYSSVSAAWQNLSEVIAPSLFFKLNRT